VWFALSNKIASALFAVAPLSMPSSFVSSAVVKLAVVPVSIADSGCLLSKAVCSPGVSDITCV